MSSSLKVQRKPVASADSSACDNLAWLMTEYGIPRALFPDEVEAYDVDLETGRFSGRFREGYDLATSNGQLRVATEITCVFRGIFEPSEHGRLEEVQGVTVEKELFGLRAVVDVESVCIADNGVVLIHALGPEILPVDRFSRHSPCVDTLPVDP